MAEGTRKIMPSGRRRARIVSGQTTFVRTKFTSCTLGLGFALVLGACGPTPPEQLVLGGATMGTGWTVKVTRPPAGTDAEHLRAGIEAVLEAVNAAMSNWRADSQISRFNRHAGSDWFPIPASFAEVMREALAVSRASGGAFDVTVAPLVDLWGFGPAQRRDSVPDAEAITAARARVGWQRLELRLQPPALRKQVPELTLELGAIAKGYAVDAVAAALEARGVHDYLVEIGGELFGRGRNARGEPWRIGIERAEPGAAQVDRVVHLDGEALATSGDYRNFFEADGRRYSHEIAPATGYPVTHATAAVSVIAASCMRADAWATALLVLGREAGLAVAEREGLAVRFVERVGGAARVYENQAFRARTGAR